MPSNIITFFYQPSYNFSTHTFATNLTVHTGVSVATNAYEDNFVQARVTVTTQHALYNKS